MRVKLFYKHLPANEDPTSILVELENEVNKWVGRLSNPNNVIIQTTRLEQGILITVTY